MDSRFKLFNAIDAENQNENKQFKKQIISNLKVLKISANNINRMLNTIDKMPGSSHILGALKFLAELTDKNSKCEDYYRHSDYLAEYFCTLSNLGFFAVGFYYNDYATLFAATFSTLSHAIPLKRLNDLDKIAAVTVFLKVISHYDLIINNPGIAVAGLATFLVGAVDMAVGRKKMDIYGPTFHAAWHLVAAFALYKFNQAQGEISANDIQAISAAVHQNTVPGYLQSCYDKICEAVTHFTPTNHCYSIL